MTLPITIRPAEDGDRNYIRATWLRDAAYSPLARTLGRKAFFSGHHDLIGRLLERAKVRVACSNESPETIVGWACVEPPAVVHYVFVREEFRRFGVARRLLHDVAERATYTHRTDACRELPIPEGWWFNFYKAVIP